MTENLSIPEKTQQILERLQAIRLRVEEACARSQRDPAMVKLLAVSKKQSLDTIRAGYAAGLRDFAENYAEEANEKIAVLTDLPGIRWEMVGHIQSRKAKSVAQGFTRIHSVDSLKLARLLNNARPAGLKPLEVLLEVNVSGELSKGGFMVTNRAEEQAFFEAVEQLTQFGKLTVTGLMVMPPLQADPEKNRGYFQKVRSLAGRLNQSLGQEKFSELSMGTSSDYQVAIEEGATIIRLGESVFGPRHYEVK